MYDSEWYSNLKKSPATPPSGVFPIVWTILYVLMACSFYFFIKENKFHASFGLALFFVQLGLNIFWSPVFFAQKNITLAFIILILLIVTVGFTIYFFGKVSSTSAYLLVPYFIWLCFAGYLNYFILTHN